MSQSYRIVVTGPFNSGKSQFIKTVSDIAVVSTERKITTEERGQKRMTTVAMDYGRVTFGNTVLHLSGTPGQQRFDFMWEILTREMHGFIVMVDSTDPTTFREAGRLAELFVRYRQVPHLVVANKADLPGSFRLEDVRHGIGSRSELDMLHCVATQKDSVRIVLLEMLGLLQANGKSR